MRILEACWMPSLIPHMIVECSLKVVFLLAIQTWYKLSLFWAVINIILVKWQYLRAWAMPRMHVYVYVCMYIHEYVHTQEVFSLKWLRNDHLEQKGALWAFTSIWTPRAGRQTDLKKSFDHPWVMQSHLLICFFAVVFIWILHTCSMVIHAYCSTVIHTCI